MEDNQVGAPVFVFARSNSSLADVKPRWRIFAHANPPPRIMPSRGVLGQPASTNNFRTPLENVNKRPTIVEWPMRNRCVSRLAIWRLAPARFASPARTVKVETSHSMPEVLSKSFEFFNDKYSANSDWPAARARLSASASASAQASSSSLTAFSPGRAASGLCTTGC